jgi:hypothetical protein
MCIRRWIAVSFSLLMVGCATVAPLAQVDRDVLASPPASIIDQVAWLQPGVVEADAWCDRIVRERGRPLSVDEIELARMVGVAHPERVRVLVTDAFPKPADPRVARELSRLGPSFEMARTTGYGIEVKPYYASSRSIYAHELTHVAQYERLGTASFDHEYLIELLTVGYARAPLETAARANERL